MNPDQDQNQDQDQRGRWRRLALTSLAMAAGAWVVGFIGLGGGLSGGERSCPAHIGCIGYAMLGWGACTLVAFGVAVYALVRSHWRGWVGWLALLTSGIPVVSIVVATVLR